MPWSSHGSIVWRSTPFPGHEYARLSRRGPAWVLEGVAVLVHDGRPSRLDYRVECDERWITRSALVEGYVGDAHVEVVLTSDGAGRWTMAGAEVPAVAGCIDVDLNFSPSTNTLPIRRLGLEVGASRAVRAAWLRFPSFVLEPLEQSYARLDTDLYRYTSASGFSAELTLDAAGLVTDYAGVWVAESGARPR